MSWRNGFLLAERLRRHLHLGYVAESVVAILWRQQFLRIARVRIVFWAEAVRPRLGGEKDGRKLA